jgi:predicted alpha/beta-fold hydrolase
MRRKDRFNPGAFDLSKLASIRTVRAFDEAYTAPYFGFAGASDYYYRASAMRVIDRVARPTLVITAEDDPFVPTQPFRDPRLTDNPHVTLLLCEHGGHCGFVSARAARERRLLGRGSDRRVSWPRLRQRAQRLPQHVRETPGLCLPLRV